MKTEISKQLLIVTLLLASCRSQDTKKLSESGKGDTLKGSGAALAVASADTIAADENFPSFWQKFRSAVLNSDTGQIMKFTEFPLETRGPNDDDTTIEFNRARFVPFFKVYLKQWSGLDLHGSTELDGIKKTELPKKTDYGKDQARMGDLLFEKKVKGWRLIFAYLNDETIDSLK
jgi:hypothetical protein